MKICIGFTEVGPMWNPVTNELRKRGHKVVYIGGESHPGYAYLYDGSHDGFLLRFYNSLSKKRSTIGTLSLRNAYKKIIIISLQRIMLLVFFFRYAFTYDAFIFVFGTSFFPGHFDILILRILGKRVFSFVAHGGESRPPFMDGRYVPINGHELNKSKLRKLKNDCRSMQRAISRISLYSNHIIGNPLGSQYIKSEFISCYYFGNLTVSFELNSNFLPKKGEVYTNSNTKPVRILHAPSAPASKGTQEIRKTLELLKAKGLEFEYTEISGVGHREVLLAISQCDFVIDQLYSDSLLPSFATEAASQKKPVIIGGYGLDIVMAVTPDHLIPPVFYVHPDNIEAAIQTLINDPKLRVEMGEKLSKFVSENYSPELFVERLVFLLKGNTPTGFMLSPTSFHYIHGVGMSEERLKNTLIAFFKIYDLEYLGLDSRPDLLSKIACLLNPGNRSHVK
jgi:glycosyltransferase involved in cell wall biosynthesis